MTEIEWWVIIRVAVANSIPSHLLSCLHALKS